jgi:hypothetical protein
VACGKDLYTFGSLVKIVPKSTKFRSHFKEEL